jgi:hypothetical protein
LSLIFPLSLSLPSSNPSPPLPSFITLALMMVTECFPETLMSTYKATQRQNSRQHHHHWIFIVGIVCNLTKCICVLKITWKICILCSFFWRQRLKQTL